MVNVYLQTFFPQMLSFQEAYNLFNMKLLSP